MPAKLYDFLTRRIDVIWFCPNCNEKVARNLKADRDIEERCRQFLQTFEHRLKTLEDKSEIFFTADDVKHIIAHEVNSQDNPH